MGLSNYNLMESIENLITDVLKMCFIEDSNKLALLKVGLSNNLYIEIIDFDEHLSPIIIQENRFEIHSQKLGKKIKANYGKRSHVENDYLFNFIFEFRFSEKLNSFYLKGRLGSSNNQVCHFLINSVGEIVREKKGDELSSLKSFYYLNSFVVNDDFVFFDLKDFEEYDLSDFFDNLFKEENFFWIRVNESRYSMFTLPDKEVFGLVFFDKDGDSPRGVFSFFKINDVKKIEFISSFKVDEWGSSHVFNNNGNKIAYLHYFDAEIKITVRELSEAKFENGITFKISLLEDSSVPINMILTDNGFVVLIFHNRIEVYNVNEQNQFFYFKRDVGSHFCFGSNKLFFIHDFKLQIKNFGN